MLNRARDRLHHVLDDATRRLDRALLPPVIEPGAMPWFSLFYLCFPLMPALLPRFPQPDWLLTWLAVLGFLPLYFLFYWVRGWRRIATLIAMAGFGLALLPANWFANTFVIYANVLAAFLSVRQMAFVVVVTQAGFAAAAYTLDPTRASVFIAMVLLSGVFAAVCNRFWIANARRQQALRLSQEEVQRLARVAERERIGRDLHDLLGHTLSVVTIKAELATKLLARDPDAAAREMADVERVAREALGQVRRAVAGMRALGLRAEFANARLALSAVEVDFEYRAQEMPLHPEIETALALALREAATNVIRHAEARRCRAELTREGDQVRLDVRDDGLGGAREGGNGIAGMRERVEALGGRLELHSPSGDGTTLTIRLPWRPPPETREPPTDASGPRRLVAVR